MYLKISSNIFGHKIVDIGIKFLRFIYIVQAELSSIFPVFLFKLYVLFGGFLWSLINVNLHLRTDSKIGLDTTSIYSKLPDFT